MFGEITVECKRDLPAELGSALAVHLGLPSDTKCAIDATINAGVYDLVSEIVYPRLVPKDLVFLISRPSISSLKVHVESLWVKNDLVLLKESIDDVWQRLSKFLTANGNGWMSCKALIYAENASLLRGKLVTRRDMVGHTFRKHAPTHVFVPCATFVLSLLFRYNLRQALINVGGAAIGLSVWFVIKTAAYKPGFVYLEEEES